ncbi:MULTISPECIES: TonB-dependent receptor domain-containing protein [Vibrio]|uniref:Vitamin B12 transporter BtuB n=2 Tax=Vibrio TaxID=662 RepID=A0A7X4RX39_9VIBR|nr:MULTISPECIES: TonB-dependent receptor [Vibrio]MBF9001899.1 TonB-dependent receptor [Vibrio nitrifigilis]MZI96067.1 TonB-dependent receptor [Vibrio eleionomae]
MKKSYIAMAVVSSWACASVSYAQTTSTDDTVVVTANRFAQNVQSTTVPVEIVTRKDIERMQANSLSEVLRTLPGVQIGSNGGYGQSQSVFVRGTNSDHILVLIDGVRFASATTGTAPFANIPLVGVERIEFLRGSRAAVYGSDAIGGVINIITDNHSNQTQLSTTAGSDNYHSGQVLASNQVTNDLHLSLGVSGVDTDGYSVKTSDMDDDGYRSKSMTTNVSYRINEQWDAGFFFLGQRGKVQYDGYYNRSNEKLYNAVTRLNYHKDSLQSRLTASANQVRSESFTDSSQSRYVTDRRELSFDNQYAFSNELSVSAGANWYKDSVSSTTDYSETSRSNVGIYVNTLYQLEQVDVEAALRSDDNQRYGQNETWQLGLGYRLNSTYRITANAGNAFKAPTFNQLYYPGYGSSDVKPEKSRNYELGMTADYDFVSLRASVYRNDLTDMIATVNDYATNYGEVSIKGLEFGAEFDTGPISHKLSYNYTDAEDKDSGNELARRAKNSAKWNVFYELDQWTFNVDYLFQGKRYDDSSNDDKLGAYSLVDLSMNYLFANGIKLSGKVGNVFDKKYELASGYITPERKYYATASYSF